MMETLTDFATVQYFGVDTVSVGVFRIWRGTFDRDAASEFATLVLVVALMIIGLERIMRGRARSSGRRPAPPLDCCATSANQAQGWWLATGVCSFILLLSFGAADAPARLVGRSARSPAPGTPNTDRFLEFLGNSSSSHR